MGWTIGCSSFKTEDELKVFIKDELEKEVGRASCRERV